MQSFSSAIDTLQTLVVVLGAGLGARGVVDESDLLKKLSAIVKL